MRFAFIFFIFFNFNRNVEDNYKGERMFAVIQETRLVRPNMYVRRPN